jgi:uncharacterized damage-inducible protein DinB
VAEKNWYALQVQEIEKFFDRSTGVLTEKDSKFAPAKGTFTVAQHVAHVAQTVDWFIEGAFRKEGFSMDFEGMNKETMKATSLKKARAWMKKACANAVKVLKSKSREDMQKPITGALMAGEPRIAIIHAMSDHTAHHRGALTVYARLLGRVPPMPYM